MKKKSNKQKKETDKTKIIIIIVIILIVLILGSFGLNKKTQHDKEIASITVFGHNIPAIKGKHVYYIN